MKIALLVQRFPYGGAEKYVEEIARRLTAKGEDVTVITSGKADNDSQYSFKIIRLSSWFSIGEYSFWRGLERVLRDGKFDIVHTNTYGYYHSDKAARLKKKLGYKLVMTSHGFTGMDLHKLKKQKIITKSSRFDFLREIYDEKIGKKTLLACDHLIALSQYDYDFYHEIGVGKSKISIIPPGVDDVFFDPNYTKLDLKGDPVLLSVGQLSWIKNQQMMINAMPHLLQNKPDAHLYLIGPDGGDLGNLKNLCKKLGVDDHVSFLGAKKASEVRDYMRAADLLLHTSYAEGLSTVLLEAIVIGLPFITTPVGGNIYLVRLYRGQIVQLNDISSLTLLTINLCKNKPHKLQQIIYTNFSWNTIIIEIYKIYKFMSRVETIPK